jgi:hypothetical protein
MARRARNVGRLLAAVTPVLAQPEAPPEPERATPVITPHAMVSAANPLAANAGLKVLKEGGSAMDAAVAVQAVLGLVEPQSSGLGGGAFMVYYDAKTRTVNLLDWIDAEQQKPVLAHELTHALQDQSFGLEKWMKVGDTDLDEKKNVTAGDIENDEIGEAREAVVEGQAMVVLVDYMLAPMDQTLLSSPQIAHAMTEGMLVGTDDSPAFQNAPIFLKEELTFPYRYGLDFEAALLKSGRDKAFAATFTEPPHTTRQIMQPETYLSGEKLPPMSLPDFKQDFKNYERFDVGAMGEFDVTILTDQYAGTKTAQEMHVHWRGGYYYAARPKGDPSAPLAILYVSRWSSSEAASEFAAIYAKALANRYKNVREAVADEKNSIADLQTIATLTGTHTWMTEEGPIVIAVQADTVLITESLDQPTTEHLEQELLGQGAPPRE